MPQDTIVYQLATHYLPKIALRIERLFVAILQACDEDNAIIHHYALKNIIEIIKLIEKPELKSRFIKDLMRFEHLFVRAQESFSNTRYADLVVQLQLLHHVAGKFGEHIHQDPFLQSIRLAQSAHQSDCELHAPQLWYWLEADPAYRKQQLSHWIEQLRLLYDTTTLYLALLRETATFEIIPMHHGFYQRSLTEKATCQLIMLRMEKQSAIIPKMQLGHHGLSLRLCHTHTLQEIEHTTFPIELAICQL